MAQPRAAALRNVVAAVGSLPTRRCQRGAAHNWRHGGRARTGVGQFAGTPTLASKGQSDRARVTAPASSGVVPLKGPAPMNAANAAARSAIYALSVVRSGQILSALTV